MEAQWQLLIDSRLEEVARARKWLSEHASAQGFSDAEVRKLGLVVSEACVNIIEHAYAGEPGNSIQLRLFIDDARLVLEIRDFGARFNLETYKPPDLSEPHEGGYGVFIMRSLMDKVEYDTSGEQGTILTLVKHRSSNPPNHNVGQEKDKDGEA